MTAAPRSPSATAAQADRAIRLAGLLTLAFLALATVPMALYARASAHAGPLGMHIAAVALAAAVLATRAPALRWLRDWMPLLLGPLLYVELRWLIAGAGRPHADQIVQAWERAVFPGEPAATWATLVHVGWVSEALHFCYASYYLLVYVPPAWLYARRRRSDFAATLLALTTVYGLCFASYLAFPVDGPRFLVGPAAAPDGPIRTVVLALLEEGSSRGTAFPSSHVAASVVASLCALRYERVMGVLVTTLTAGLAAATVYGGFHYAVDALAGGIVGVLAWGLASVVWRAVSTPGAQSASAAW